MTKKNLLFITSVIPSRVGRGRNLRAFQWINHLSSRYNVSVLCTARAGEILFSADELQELFNCRIYKWNAQKTSFIRLKDSLFLRPGIMNANGWTVGEKLVSLKIPRPDVIMSFRLLNASLALQAGSYWSVQEMWLDLDELDSKTKKNIMKLKLTSGYYKDISKSILVTLRYRYKESMLLSQFKKVYTSTRDEREFIASKFQLKHTDVFENMLSLQHVSGPTDVDNETFTFLFVGNSSYFPNRDAIDTILFRIVPELKRITSRPFNFVIVGGNAGKQQLLRINQEKCIDYYTDVENLESVYRRTHAVIIPLRTGGGSSLKFLEALRHHKPVVSSPVGIRGFDVEHGEQVLIGENEKELARQCHALMEDQNLYKKLSTTGHQWFIENNSYQIEAEERQEVFS